MKPAWPIKKRLRFAGKATFLITFLFLIGTYVFFTNSDEDNPRFYYSWFWIMGGVGLGCFFLWWASLCDPKD